MNAKEHYDNHLGNFYAWMVGEFQEKQAEQEAFFREAGIHPLRTGRAIDLGCGHGLQAVSLANIGFDVDAVDFNDQLLSLLSAQSYAQIHIQRADIFDFMRSANYKADLVVCMGDTLTHLPDTASVVTLIKICASRLITTGKLVLSFRDLTTELKSEERFIHVRSDEYRIHTCFLEYFPRHVHVYDILHERTEGSWRQKVSRYPKLRLGEDSVKEILLQNNFRIVYQKTINRMIYLVAEILS